MSDHAVSPKAVMAAAGPLADWRTVAALAVTLVLWASAFVGIRAGLKGYAPAELALLRYLVASVAIGAYALATGIRLPARRDWGRIALTGFLGFTVYNLALNTGATRVTAASASFVGNTVPVFSALAAVLFLGERLRARAWAGIFVSFLGAAVIAAGEGGGLRLEPAVLLVLVAALAQCAYFILQKPLLARMSALEYTAAALWSGTLFMLPALPDLVGRLPRAPLHATLAAVYLGVFPAAVGYVTWAYVLARLPVARTTSFLYLVPPLATLIGWLWLSELPSWLSLVGGGIGVVGVVLVNRSAALRSSLPSPPEVGSSRTDAKTNGRHSGRAVIQERPEGVLPVKRTRAAMRWWLVLLGSALLAGDVAAGPPPRVEIPRIARAPSLEDFEGMRPGPDVAGQMLKVEGFLQRVPSDGAPVSQRTEVYLAYDQQNIYAVFVCFDSEPEKIRARMGVRNEIFSDDFVTLQLDTFRDQRRAYVFGSNPLGIQGDAIWVEGVGFDQSFDTVFDTRGKLTDEGYVAWIRVPFKSLRFPTTQRQTWGILLTRDIPRGSEESFWPQYTLRIEGRLNQMATLEGLENVSPGRNIQITPYGVFRGFSRELDVRDPAAPAFTRRTAQVDGGVDAKFILKDALVLDVTVNPDFSQVESDQPQVTTNQRFELFFPEKRPFFLENASFFDTPIPLFFTRRIADPQFGVRLTGKVGRFGIGALVADDQSPGRLVAPGDPLAGKRAHFAIVRVNRDLWAQSSLGMIYTDREFAEGFNRVGGVDGRFKLNRNWVAGAQAVASSTRFPDGTQIGGPASDFFLRGSGRHFLYDLTFNDRSQNFRTDTGFVPRTDIRHLSQTVEYLFRPERTLSSWGPRLFAETNLDHAGTQLDWIVIPRVGWSFRRATALQISYAFGGERLRPQDFPGLTRDLYNPVANGAVLLESSFFSVATLRAFSWFAGTGHNFVPAPGRLPTLENLYVGSFGVTLRPTTRLVIENSYLVTRLSRRQGGESIFNNHILRSRWNYQFTPRLAARFIAQYDAVLANPAFSSLENRKNFNADFLITYLVHPGTAVFVGYNSNLQNLDRSLTVTPGGLLRTRNRFLNDGRQFFVKASYQFRF